MGCEHPCSRSDQQPDDQLLQRLDDPRAREITGDADRLARPTPNWKEFSRGSESPTTSGDGALLIRGGYGLFFDQVFQNLTIFSMTQSGPSSTRKSSGSRTSDVGVGQLPTFRFGVDPLPAPPAFTFAQLPAASFGRINDPGVEDPYVHKLSIGFERHSGPLGHHQ